MEKEENMKKITYHQVTGEDPQFLVRWDRKGRLVSLQNSRDEAGMNWVKGEQVWGTVICEPELTMEVNRHFTERGTLAECYTFRNETDFDIWTLGTQVGICA